MKKIKILVISFIAFLFNNCSQSHVNTQTTVTTQAGQNNNATVRTIQENKNFKDN